MRVVRKWYESGTQVVREWYENGTRVVRERCDGFGKCRMSAKGAAPSILFSKMLSSRGCSALTATPRMQQEVYILYMAWENFLEARLEKRIAEVEAQEQEVQRAEARLRETIAVQGVERRLQEEMQHLRETLKLHGAKCSRRSGFLIKRKTRTSTQRPSRKPEASWRSPILVTQPNRSWKLKTSTRSARRKVQSRP